MRVQGYKFVESKIITILLGGTQYLFWDSEDVYFAFVDVATCVYSQ